MTRTERGDPPSAPPQSDLATEPPYSEAPLRAEVAPVVVALPTQNRNRSFAFYREGVGLEAFGDLAADGVPEPLQFALNDGIHLMLVPTGGFGWITGNRPSAEPGVSECLLALTVADEHAVRELFERALRAGAAVVLEPAEQDWGYTAAFADPDGHVWQIRPQ